MGRKRAGLRGNGWEEEGSTFVAGVLIGCWTRIRERIRRPARQGSSQIDVARRRPCSEGWAAGSSGRLSACGRSYSLAPAGSWDQSIHSVRLLAWAPVQVDLQTPVMLAPLLVFEVVLALDAADPVGELQLQLDRGQGQAAGGAAGVQTCAGLGGSGL